MSGTCIRLVVSAACWALIQPVSAASETKAQEQVLHSFSGGTDGKNPHASLIDVNGTLYGTTQSGGNSSCNVECGTVFSLNPNTGAEKVLHSFGSGTDGDTPNASLINVKGTLYGTTFYGGNDHVNGTLFALDRRLVLRRCSIRFAASRIAQMVPNPAPV